MKNIKFLVALLSVVFLASCTGYKNLTYFTDMELGKEYRVSESPDLKIQKTDKLAIGVSSSNPELAAPFNGGIVSMNVESGATNVTGAGTPKEYIVDRNGDILFPILGVLRVEGLTLDELCSTIENKIKAGSYLTDPIVKADFTNFKITVMGEGSKGVFTMPENKMNIIDALAMVGGVPKTAKNNDIIVIRTENGVRKSYSVSLRTVDIFDSPVYNLQQNDIIYIKPNRYQTDGLRGFITSNLTFVLSTVSMFASAYFYLLLR